jgi:hypothetical protein
LLAIMPVLSKELSCAWNHGVTLALDSRHGLRVRQCERFIFLEVTPLSHVCDCQYSALEGNFTSSGTSALSRKSGIRQFLRGCCGGAIGRFYWRGKILLRLGGAYEPQQQ